MAMNNGRKESLKLKLGQHRIKRQLLNQAKNEGNIIFGGRAIRKKLGIRARPTDDFDFFSKKPKKSANLSESNLDSSFRRDVFFTKKGKNPGTWKVKHKGRDLKARTKDDVGIADYTRMPSPKPKTFTDNGIKYRSLKEELDAKKRLVKNKEFEFRREKDLKDLNKIKSFLKSKGRLK